MYRMCILARDLRSKMSRIQLPIVKSFRVRLCEQPPKKIFDRTPKGVRKVCLKFPNSCRQAVWPVLHTACLHWLETSNTLYKPLFGSNQKKNFGGCSQRLTLKDFTTMSWIRDKVAPYCLLYFAQLGQFGPSKAKLSQTD